MPGDLKVEPGAELYRETILYHWERALSRKLPQPYRVEAEDANGEVLLSGEIPKDAGFLRYIKRPVPSQSVSFPVTVRLVADDGTEQSASIEREGAAPKFSA